MNKTSWLVGWFKILGWVLYLGLFITSISFTWEVKEKFYSGTTGIEKYDEEIKSYPTMTMCFKEKIWKYGRDFNMTYATMISVKKAEDKAILRIGENNLGTSDGKLYMKEIYTEWEGYCYSITALRKINGNYITIKIWPPQNDTDVHRVLNDIAIYFTSEENSYGITKRNWKDGKVYPMSITEEYGRWKIVELGVEKHIKFDDCSEYSFYECAGTKISKSDFSNCSVACMPITFPNVSYPPQCKNYESWFEDHDGDDCAECNCNWNIINEIIKNIEFNNECPRTCSTIQYPVFHEMDYQEDTESAIIQYKLSIPLVVQTNKEYIIFDAIGMIGSVGGTLGLFIGFSFSNVLTIMIEYLQLSIDQIYSRKIKPTHIKRIPHNGEMEETYDENLNKNTRCAKKFARLELQIQQEKDKMIKVEKQLSQVVMQLAKFKNNEKAKF